MKWEVRTMRSATSCSKALIRSDWRRFWPLTFLYAFVSFFIMPVMIWNEGTTYSYYDVVPTAAEQTAQRAFRMANLAYETIPGFTIINLFLGVALAMMLFGYLMKSNSVGLMHALPVSRTRQFFSHFAAGMSMLTAANLLTFLLSVLMECMIGLVDVVPLLIWLLVTELVGFFFLTFGALCAMATGWLLAVPVIYFGLNYATLAYYAIFNGIASILWTDQLITHSPGPLVTWLTPTLKLTEVLDNGSFGEETYQKGATLFTVSPNALPTVLIYALVGLAMLAFALVLYRARHSETAGDAIVFPWLRPVVKYVISIAAGLALGTFVFEIFLNGGRSVPGLIICQLVMGGLTYCGVEMLLRKSYRIFDKRTWIGLAALFLAIIAVCVCIKLDVTGYKTRVPAAEKVTRATVYSAGDLHMESDDPGAIAAVTELHRALTQQKERRETDNSVFINIEYSLRNGSKMSRCFDANLGDPAVYRALSELMNRPGLLAGRRIPQRGEYGDHFIGGYIFNYMYDTQEIALTADQALALYRALEADSDAPLRPEELYSDEYLPIRLELLTEQGSYSVDSVSTRCVNTVALLEEYGVTIPEEFYKDMGFKD